jgi:beta-galactosidase
MSNKTKHFLAITILMYSFLALSGQVINLEKNWQFTLGDPEDAHLADFNDSGWRTVQIPHDWAIEGPFDAMLPANTGKLPWKDVGWYRNRFMIKSGILSERIYLMCDGIMAFPKVYVNGELAGAWDYGYNSFFLDITPFVNPEGENVIAIRVDTRQFDSRWYPGAGIYRKVQLVIRSAVHHTIWGTYVQTPVVNNDSALLHVHNQFENTLSKVANAEIRYKVLGPEGKEVASKRITSDIPAESHLKTTHWITLDQPKRWDVDHPNLYTLVSTLIVGNEIMDVSRTRFGIRTFRFTADDGFWLNGRRLQLKGVNLHHDHGPLGAKFYSRAMERQLEIMKEMGANAIRNSHNVAAPELLQMCDSMGLIFFNEVFDKWDAKAGYLPEMDFDEFAERNIRNWVMRDRNHPCVVLWSVGNEMGDIQYNIDGGFDKLNTMIGLVRKYDPTRPVTMVCDAKGSAPWRHFDYYDVHAWNYGRRYLPAREIEPGKSVVISESASTLSTRGFYELPLPEKKTDFTQSLQVSSYDLNAPYWAEVADDDFMWQEEDTYVAGEFVWTGFDYLGEPTPYNDEAVKDGFITQEQSAKSSYFGIVDLCGIPKDRYYLYKSYWKPEDTTIHILPHFNRQSWESPRIPIFVYTNGDCAELFINGISSGKKCKKPESENSVERYRIMWMDVPFDEGEIKAVAYKDGKAIGEQKVMTAGDPFRLKLTADRHLLNADGHDLAYVLVEAFDKNGIPCPLADNLVAFEIDGPGVIEGVGNGNPQSLEPFLANERKLFYGKAMAIIRTTGEPGKIKLTAKSKGLKKSVESIVAQ